MRVAKSLAVSALALVTVAAMAQSNPAPVKVVIDGNPVQFDNQQPTENDGRILVPLRGVFEKLGAHVNWDPSTQTITARRNDTRVKLAIGQLDAAVNGQSTQMDVAATLVNGVTMVPLRFVSEALGAFVNWDQADHEVDITSSTNYHLPKQETPPPPPPQPPTPPVVILAPPPPPVVQTPPPPPVESRPLRVVRTYDEIGADTVLPLRLDTRLSTKDSKPGDPFTATLETGGASHYLNLPAGTQAFGTVAYIKKQHRREPGVIELRFDHLLLPDGSSLPVNGRLIGLNDTSVTRSEGGKIIANNEKRGETMVFVSDGQQNALIVGLPTERPLTDAMLPGLLASALDRDQRSRLAYDAELHRGTSMGLRLYDPLVIPRKDQ